VTQWIDKQKDVAALPLGYFGASTGAASALKAAAYFGNRIRAVVSRGGRPDLAMDDLPQLKAPTLLIIGEWDHMVIGLNKQAYERLSCKRRLEIISQASHLFEEPGKLQEVATLATRWFKKYLN
jgi:pimeloyl-ACP methyl ester carboxylesterase